MPVVKTSVEPDYPEAARKENIEVPPCWMYWCGKMESQATPGCIGVQAMPNWMRQQ